MVIASDTVHETCTDFTQPPRESNCSDSIFINLSEFYDAKQSFQNPRVKINEKSITIDEVNYSMFNPDLFKKIQTDRLINVNNFFLFDAKLLVKVDTTNFTIDSLYYSEESLIIDFKNERVYELNSNSLQLCEIHPHMSCKTLPSDKEILFIRNSIVLNFVSDKLWELAPSFLEIIFKDNTKKYIIPIDTTFEIQNTIEYEPFLQIQIPSNNKVVIKDYENKLDSTFYINCN